MKIIRDTPVSQAADANDVNKEGAVSRYKWKLLIVDDEPDIRTLTRISLRDFVFANRSLEFIEAASAAEAIQLLQAHNDIAVTLIDVVMETDDAGLKLVEYIRKELGNLMIRIVIRTGQPGVAPERYVIDHFDIDDYKDKTELTAGRLYATVRSALKAYKDLQTINTNRLGLERVLQAAPNLYHLDNSSLSIFFNGMLTQISGLCQLSDSSHISGFEGFVTTINHQEAKIQACTAKFTNQSRFAEIHRQCSGAIFNGQTPRLLRENAEVLALTVANHPVGYIYIEPIEPLSDIDKSLIHIFARQCSQALENRELHSSIVASFESAVDMLAEIAEYKDKATGGHVNRLDHYTRMIAMEMGVAKEEALRFGKASRLHDVGKVGIPDHILSKPCKLTNEEFEIIKRHTTLGANILGHDPTFELARQIALYHHERWDGNGYPTGIMARELPLATRIVSVADVFDAMISWRPYKEPWSIQEARETVAKEAGTQFDPEVVKAFLRVLDKGGFDSVVIVEAGQAF
ncbi:MAG: HD domain-containing phosphohydrolase [Gammaproteobacteria bacterium]